MRSYIVDLPGGTATTSITITEPQTFKNAVLSFLSTAAGKIELSRSVTSQIGTAAPTRDVIARVNCSATAGNVVAVLPISEKFKTLDVIYIHQTGAGNLASVTLNS